MILICTKTLFVRVAQGNWQRISSVDSSYFFSVEFVEAVVVRTVEAWEKDNQHMINTAQENSGYDDTMRCDSNVISSQIKISKCIPHIRDWHLF